MPPESRRKRFTPVVLFGLAAAVAFGITQALAQSPSSTVAEQHWELLGETIQASSAVTEPLSRGVLPSGTTKFNPAPTATLEVVGKTTAALNGGFWTVALKDATSTLAEVTFGASDSAFSIKTAPIAWPSTDKTLYSLSLTPGTGGGPGDVAGVVNIQKAYIKFHQEGTLKAVTGRYPMMSAPVRGMTATDYSQIAPIYYTHQGADYDPAPTIKLRVGAQMISGATGTAAIVDVSTDSVVGTVSIGTTRDSYESSALTLTNGSTYQLRAEVPNAGDSMDLFSADLVFAQSTSDAYGLYKTVGWYPSVTIYTAATATSATDLDFRFRAPDSNVFGSSRKWVSSLKAGTRQRVYSTLHDRSGNFNPVHGFDHVGNPEFAGELCVDDSSGFHT